MKNKKGVTILEIVIFILLVSIALIPLLSLFGNVLNRSAGQHTARSAGFLAQGMIEELTGADFSEINEDFVAQKETEFNERHLNFTASASVDYVQPDNFNLPVEPGVATDFKRIMVSVIWSGGKTEFVTIAANRQ